MKKLCLCSAILLAFTSACFPPFARATTLARMSLAELARAADTIVRVRCLVTAGRWDAGAIWTFTEFEVVEKLKGASPQEIRVRVPGGRVGHLVAAIEAAPRFVVGEESVLFLEKNAEDDYSVIAWAAGTFRISRDSPTDQRNDPVVTQDSSRFAVFDQGTRRFHTEGVRNLSLEEFRRRLAAAMAQSASGAAR